MREANKDRREKLSPEAYRRMVTANVGRRFTEAHRQKIADANRRRVLSEETRKKISDARKRAEEMKKQKEME